MSTFNGGLANNYANADTFGGIGIASITIVGSDATEMTFTYSLSAIQVSTNGDSGPGLTLSDALYVAIVEGIQSAVESTYSSASSWAWYTNHAWQEGETVST